MTKTTATAEAKRLGLKKGEYAIVAQHQTCNIHGDHPAYADCSINYNGRRTWAYICKDLFDDPALGARLGMGLGQVLIQA